MLLVVLVFLAGFYSARLVLTALLPAASIVVTSSSGMVLSLLLALVLFQLGDPGTRNLERPGRGILGSAWYVLSWLPLKVLPLVRHYKAVCRRVIYGGPPPVEGPDVQ
ncbi:MAG: hypothetical protein U9P14_12550 [Gemmatimonadota bacterium]|nr:hypothetical protein [Gemmatimonadota bacterium]